MANSDETKLKYNFDRSNALFGEVFLQALKMKNGCLKYLLWVAFYATSHFVSAQNIRGRANLGSFDERYYHFGFLLSGNSSSFFIDYKPDFTFSDSLLGISNDPQMGFNLALLASANFTKNVNLRFVPGLSFQDRRLIYRYVEDGKTETFMKNTESVWLQFPLLLKLRTNRVGNFAAYALVGGSYGIDMQSQRDVNENVAGKIVIKMQKTDFTIDAGGGFDFFLPYFKFGIELKTAFGMKDMLIQENNQFTDPISKMRTRAFVISLCFEG